MRVLSVPKTEVVSALRRSKHPHAPAAADYFQKMPEETLGQALWVNRKESMSSRRKVVSRQVAGLALAGASIGAVLAKVHPAIYGAGMLGAAILIVSSNASANNASEDKFLNYWAGELSPQFEDSATQAGWIEEAASRKVTSVGREDLVGLLGRITEKLPAEHSAREQLEFELGLLRNAPGETLEEVRTLSNQRSQRAATVAKVAAFSSLALFLGSIGAAMGKLPPVVVGGVMAGAGLSLGLGTWIHESPHETALRATLDRHEKHLASHQQMLSLVTGAESATEVNIDEDFLDVNGFLVEIKD